MKTIETEVTGRQQAGHQQEQQVTHPPNQPEPPEQHINIRERQALIDKVDFGGVRIKGFTDIERLIREGTVEVSTSPCRYITEDGQEFTRLTIEGDPLIDKLTAGVKQIGGSRCEYCNLSTTVKDKPTGNLDCNTVTEYWTQLERIKDHLEDEYGILADFKNVTLKQIEINRTFRLDEDFERYHRPIMVILENLPYYMSTQSDVRDTSGSSIKYQCYYANSKKNPKSKRYIELKIYDKTAALEHIIWITDHYMRLEIKLVGAERIKKALGTCRFADLTDSIINAYFNEQMERMIVQPTRNWRETQQRYLLALFREERRADIKHWQTNLLRKLEDKEIERRSPVVLDVEELMPVIDQLGLKPNRKYDVKRNFRRQAARYETALTHRDDLKLMEIIGKLTATDTVKDTAMEPLNTVIERPNAGRLTTYGGIQKAA